VPAGRLTNDDLAARLDTSDSWIIERTGIRERRVSGPGDTTSGLAVAAGGAAIKHAGLVPTDIDLLVVATCTPDQQLPQTSAFVHDGLGLRCGAFDLHGACAGFVYGLVTAAGVLGTGTRHVLLVGAERLTTIVDPEDRTTAVLFGDGAGALVLGVTEGPGALLGWDAGCDGGALGLLEIPPGERFLRMDGREVFRRAVRVVVSSAMTALERSGLTAADVALFIPHQANARIIDASAARLGVPPERTFVNVDRYGNTSAASVPIALAEAADAGRLGDGDVVLLSGFGSGMTWASAVLRWGRS
jgi:3-oxoacyl-[acyl-carrier-protein] synthase-3